MTRIKVLPVYPEFPLTFWSYKTAVKAIGKKAIMPPTGLATVLAMLPEDKFEIQKVVDLNVRSLTDKEIGDSDVVMTSTMIVQESSHNEVIERAHLFGKKVIAGGPFPTSYPERNAEADYIVGGEAEITLPAFLDDFVTGNPKHFYDEKSVIASGRNLASLTAGGKPDLRNTPLPRWDLVDMSAYLSAAIQYSRGCPFDCEFCDITALYGREPRTKTPEQMIKELAAIHRTRHKGNVFIVDDNFVGNRKNVRGLLPVLEEWQIGRDYPFSFYTEASMNLAWDENKDILEAMIRAGFDSVFLGIESTNLEVLKAMNKKQNTKLSPLEAVKRIQNAGLEVTGGFIIGSDGEKLEVFKELFEFVQEAGIVVPMVGLLTPVKGTKLYERLKREGRLYEESSGNNTHHLGFSFKTELDKKFLLEGYKQLLQDVFDDRNYYHRARVLQKNLGKRHALNRGGLEGVVAFGKSLKSQLFAKGGLEYAKYLLGTLITQPRQFPEAVAHAIKLNHFKTITHATIAADNYIPKTETLYHQFKEDVSDISTRYIDDARKAIADLSKKAHQIIDRAEKEYQRLHKDFRANASQALAQLKERVQTELDSYPARCAISS